jgi:ubiquinone/menaquinone biosynthesis C-methylase UbiE
MPAAYDTYDYPAYWKEREYEQGAECAALRTLLSKIPKIEKILDVGCGYGRLFSTYAFRAKKIILSDPSAKLLSTARKNTKDNKKVELVQSSLENLPFKVKRGSVDLIVMVRVLHHLENTKDAFAIISNLLKDNGYLILEFANKGHFKSVILEMFKGNITFPLDLSSKDIRSEKSKKAGTLPFVNYHPDAILQELKDAGFTVLNKLSVSNIRSTFIKKVVSTPTLLAAEKFLQQPLGYINFGPSIFILAQKYP